MGCTNDNILDTIDNNHHSQEVINPDSIKLVSYPQYQKQAPIKITIHCDNDETITNILIPQNQTINFIVEGKWKPDPTLPECDSTGFKNYLINKFNYGALVGKIICINNNKYNSELFLIKNGTSYTNNSQNGLLILRMNNNQRTELCSSGKLTVTVTGGLNIENEKSLNFEKIDRYIGWETEKIYGNILKYDEYYNKFEIDFLIMVNKIRCFPKNFMLNYIILETFDIQNIINYDEKNLNSLQVDDNINKAMDEFINNYLYKNNISEDSLKSCLNKEKIKNVFFMCEKINDKYRSNQILFKYILNNEVIKEKLFEGNITKFGARFIPYGKAFFMIFILS